MNTESLKQFRDPTQKPRKAVWAPPGRGDFAQGHLIAFDPSLSACGVVAITVDDRGVIIDEAHSFPSQEMGATGNEENFRKAMALAALVTQWRIKCGTDLTSWPFVHEAPPIGGGRIRSPESALLAGLAVRASMWGHDCRGMIAPAAHKNFICGNSKADKKEHHAALRATAERLRFLNYELITNEAKRDALSVALSYMAWKKRNDSV